MTRKEQKEERRKQILDIALDLFITKGFEATKITDIANRAKMSIGLLFHYFDSKECLYQELIKLGTKRASNSLSLDTEKPLNFFEGLTKNIFNGITNNLFAAKMFVLMMLDDRNFGFERTNANILKTAKIIERGQQEGAIRNGDAVALAVLYWSAVQGLCQMLINKPSLPCPDYRWIISIIKATD